VDEEGGTNPDVGTELPTIQNSSLAAEERDNSQEYEEEEEANGEPMEHNINLALIDEEESSLLPCFGLGRTRRSCFIRFGMLVSLFILLVSVGQLWSIVALQETTLTGPIVITPFFSSNASNPSFEPSSQFKNETNWTDWWLTSLLLDNSKAISPNGIIFSQTFLVLLFPLLFLVPLVSSHSFRPLGVLTPGDTIRVVIPRFWPRISPSDSSIEILQNLLLNETINDDRDVMTWLVSCNDAKATTYCPKHYRCIGRQKKDADWGCAIPLPSSVLPSHSPSPSPSLSRTPLPAKRTLSTTTYRPKDTSDSGSEVDGDGSEASGGEDDENRVDLSKCKSFIEKQTSWSSSPSTDTSPNFSFFFVALSSHSSVVILMISVLSAFLSILIVFTLLVLQVIRHSQFLDPPPVPRNLFKWTLNEVRDPNEKFWIASLFLLLPLFSGGGYLTLTTTTPNLTSLRTTTKNLCFLSPSSFEHLTDTSVGGGVASGTRDATSLLDLLGMEHQKVFFWTTCSTLMSLLLLVFLLALFIPRLYLVLCSKRYWVFVTCFSLLIFFPFVILLAVL
jgi:hypothetical protein